MALRNKLLASLPDVEIKRLGTALELIPLPLRKVLYEPNRTISDVCFPCSGVVSIVSEPLPAEIVELATVGREGMIGIALLLGDTTSPNQAFVQVAGEGYRLSAGAFHETVDRNAGFRLSLMRYTLALFSQISQSAACNRLHEVQERMARWLLQTHDRVDSDTFPLTQEFLAQMLGVHRPTVSVAAGMLHKAGLISYTRGIVTIRDRQGLEAASCDCYRIVSAEYDRLLGNPLSTVATKERRSAD